MPCIKDPNIAAYNPIIGLTPDEIANAQDKGIETRATVNPDIVFSIINYK